jgi:monooxygenase
MRSIDRFPKQGAKAPWRLYQNYALDIFALRFGALEDGTLQFSSVEPSLAAPEAVAA